MATQFDGKNVVITGATGALGGAVLGPMVDAGATVYLPCVEPDVADRIELAGHPRVHVRAGVDLTDEAGVEGFYRDLPGLWASVHLVGGFTMQAVVDTPLAGFERMLRLNAVTCFLCCREAVKAIGRGAGGGRIVNVAARPVVQPVGGMLSYSVAKAAVAAMTTALAAEVLDAGILVNAILPSIIDSAANRAAMPDADHAAWPRAEEIAHTIRFLASPDNHLTSGALIPVYGRA